MARRKQNMPLDKQIIKKKKSVHLITVRVKVQDPNWNYEVLKKKKKKGGEILYLQKHLVATWRNLDLQEGKQNKLQNTSKEYTKKVIEDWGNYITEIWFSFNTLGCF